MSSIIERLPQELCDIVLDQLDYADILTLRFVSKSFHTISRHNRNKLKINDNQLYQLAVAGSPYRYEMSFGRSPLTTIFCQHCCILKSAQEFGSDQTKKQVITTLSDSPTGRKPRRCRNDCVLYRGPLSRPTACEDYDKRDRAHTRPYWVRGGRRRCFNCRDLSKDILLPTERIAYTCIGKVDVELLLADLDRSEQVAENRSKQIMAHALSMPDATIPLSQIMPGGERRRRFYWTVSPGDAGTAAWSPWR